MKVVVTFDIDENNLDDLVVMAKVYKKKDGYKEFVSVENNLHLKPLPEKNTWDVTDNGHITEFAEGWNACLEELEK